MNNIEFYFITILFVTSYNQSTKALLRKRSTSLTKRIYLPLNLDLRYEINDNYWGWIPVEVHENDSDSNSLSLNKRSFDEHAKFISGSAACNKNNATIEPDTIYESDDDEEDEGLKGTAAVVTMGSSSSTESTKPPSTTASSTTEKFSSTSVATKLKPTQTTMPTKVYEGDDCTTTIKVTEQCITVPSTPTQLLEEICSDDDLAKYTELPPNIITPPNPLPPLNLDFITDKDEQCTKKNESDMSVTRQTNNSMELPIKSSEIEPTVGEMVSVSTSSYQLGELTSRTTSVKTTTKRRLRTNNTFITTKGKSSNKSTSGKLTTKHSGLSFFNRLFGLSVVNVSTTETDTKIRTRPTCPHVERQTDILFTEGTTELSHTTEGTNKPTHTTEGTNEPIHTTEGTNKPIQTTKGTNKPTHTTKRTNKHSHSTEGTDSKHSHHTSEETTVKHIHTSAKIPSTSHKTTTASTLSTSKIRVKESTSNNDRISNNNNIETMKSNPQLPFNSFQQKISLNDETQGNSMQEPIQKEEAIGQVIIRIPSSLGDIPVVILKDPEIPELTMSVVPVDRDLEQSNNTGKQDISNSLQYSFNDRNIDKKMPNLRDDDDMINRLNPSSFYNFWPYSNPMSENLLSLPIKFSDHHLKWKTPVIKKRNVIKTPQFRWRSNYK